MQFVFSFSFFNSFSADDQEDCHCCGRCASGSWSAGFAAGGGGVLALCANLLVEEEEEEDAHGKRKKR